MDSKRRLFDEKIVGDPLDFIISLLQASTEYSVIGKGLDGTILLWNEGARRIYGYEPEEVIGRASATLLHSEEDVKLGRHKEIMELALKRGKWEGVVNRRRKNGEIFAAKVVITTRHGPDGKPIGYLLISKDISKESATEVLKATQAYTRSLIEASLDGLIAVNMEGIITDVNSQMEILTDCPRLELIGTPAKQYFTKPQDAEEAFQITLRDGRVLNYELTLISKEGRKTDIFYNATTLKDSSGKLTGIFIAIRDATQLKSYEELLKQQNIELQAASLAKDRFLSSMSHEFRTPLNSIIGFTDILLLKWAGPLTAEQEEQLITIQKNGKLLLSLINDLLDTAKITSGKWKITKEPLECQQVIQDVLDSLKPLIEKKKLELKVQLPKEKVIIENDRRAMSQILLNLLNNALKFTEKGSIEVILNASKNVVTIDVIDTGIGIKKEEQSKLFQAFEQLGDKGAAAGLGTGLGLNLCKQLANNIGGNIEFESEYEKGSRFTLILPQAMSS